MSMMCSSESCKAKQGFCGHEKMMLVIMIVAILAGVGHWALNWF